ncbi:hypothetical protein TNCV_134261 [Trichonephila clavipes]|nr:hypothetical protein TNCV_134261 [Trichonephila clavipes]
MARGLTATDIVNLDLGQVKRTAHKLAPYYRLPLHANAMTSSPGRFNVHQIFTPLTFSGIRAQTHDSTAPATSSRL